MEDSVFTTAGHDTFFSLLTLPGQPGWQTLQGAA